VYVVGLLDEGLAEHLSGFGLDAHDRLTQHMQVAGKTSFRGRGCPAPAEDGAREGQGWNWNFRISHDNHPNGIPIPTTARR
jgi:hypothetical protein